MEISIVQSVYTVNTYFHDNIMISAAACHVFFFTTFQYKVFVEL